MAFDNEEMKYKNLFRKNEAETDIPEFEEILNLPARQKKQSGRLFKLVSVMAVCMALFIGIYYFHDKPQSAGISKNEFQFSHDKKALIWEWKSPTQELLAISSGTTFKSFNTPTDFLLPNIKLLQSNNKKK